MSNRLKTVILWSFYFAVVIVLLFTFVLLVVQVLAPTFFPTRNISGIKQYINTFCIILSFLSVGLGFCSIYQALESSKQANELGKQTREILKSVQVIERDQQIAKGLMQMIAVDKNDTKTRETSDFDKSSIWKADNDVT